MKNMENVRDKTIQVLIKNNIPLHPHLPLLEKPKFRSSIEISHRVIALYSLAGIANGAAGGLIKEWLVDDGGWGFLSEIEQEKVSRENLVRNEINELSWKQESLYALCWCSALTEDMTWPISEANITDIFQFIPPEVPISEFVGSTKLVDTEQIVQQLDLYYCLHAAIVHPELWNESDTKLKIEVILERRQALEWVCSKHISWDEISLDT